MPEPLGGLTKASAAKLGLVVGQVLGRMPDTGRRTRRTSSGSSGEPVIGKSAGTSSIYIEHVRFGSSGTNHKQRFILYGSPTAGTGTVTDGTTPQTYHWDDSAATFQGLLEAMFGSGNVTCTGGPFPGSVITATWAGDYADQFVPLLTGSGALTTLGVHKKRTFGKFNLYTGLKGSEASSGESVIAYNRLGDIPTSREAILMEFGNGWECVAADAC